MSKDPAFLFYSSDFISGVSDLTMEERGQYITLLCLQHQKGHLSEKLIKISLGNATADVLQKFSIDSEGLFFSKRLDAEIKKRSEHSEKQRERAKEGWKKRKATADATALPLENEIENRNIITNEKGKGVIGEKPKSEIPTWITFLTYAIEKEPSVNHSALKNKYDAWLENDWKDGYNKPIKNWKSTLLHTMPHIKKDLKNGTEPPKNRNR